MSWSWPDSWTGVHVPPGLPTPDTAAASSYASLSSLSSSSSSTATALLPPMMPWVPPTVPSISIPTLSVPNPFDPFDPEAMATYSTSPANDQWPEFIVYLALLALPGLVMAFVSLCCCFWCALCKCCAATCCRCCSCCTDNERALYLRSKNPTYRTVFFVVWAVIIGATIVGFVGARKTQSGLHTFGDEVQGTVDTIDSIIQQIGVKANEAAAINGTQASGFITSLSDFTADASRVTNQLRDGRSTLDSYLDAFIAVINTGFALPLVSLTLSVIAYLLRFKPANYSLLIYTISTVTSTFVWLSFAFAMPSAVFVRQACDVELRNNPEVDSIFGRCMDAVSSAGPINSLQQPLQDLLTELKDNAQQFGINIDATLPPQNATIPDTITTWSAFTNAQIEAVQSSSAFQNAPDSNGYKQQINAELSAARILMDILALVARLADCSFLTALFDAIVNNVCGTTVDGFFFMAHADWIIGALLVPGTFVLMAVFRAAQPGDKQLAADIDPNAGATNAQLGMGGLTATQQVTTPGTMAGVGVGGSAQYPAGAVDLTQPQAPPSMSAYGFASHHGASAPLQYNTDPPQPQQPQQPQQPEQPQMQMQMQMQQPAMQMQPTYAAAPGDGSSYPVGAASMDAPPPPPPPGGDSAYAQPAVTGVVTLPDGTQVQAPGTQYQA